MMEHFGYLKAANRGDIEQIKSLSNSQIDSEFVIHTVWQDSKWQWLLPAMQTDNDKYAKAIATYRLSHPYQQKPIDLSNFSDSDKELMQQRFNDHQQDIKRAYDRYRK